MDEVGLEPPVEILREALVDHTHADLCIRARWIGNDRNQHGKTMIRHCL
jgi:hypothetical protein